MTENRDVLTRPAPPPDLTLSYGAGTNQVIDIWLPPAPAPTPTTAPAADTAGPTADPVVDTAGPVVASAVGGAAGAGSGVVGGGAPVVVVWHGGFWRAEWGRAIMGPFAADLAARGYVVAAPEYHRTGPGLGWPETFTDVAAAADALPGLLEAALPGAVDPDRVVYAGHSAGGHLAVWAAARDRLPVGAPGRTERAPRVAGVLALAPVLDLAEAHRLGLDGDAVAALLGGGPAEQRERYAAADPAALGPPAAPVTIVHGDRDGRVPVTMSRDYRLGPGGGYIEVPDADHFALIDPASSAWPVVVGALAPLAARPR